MSVDFLSIFNVVEITDNPNDQRLLMNSIENNILLEDMRQAIDEYNDHIEEEDEDTEDYSVEEEEEEEEDKFEKLVWSPFSMAVTSITHVASSVAIGFCTVVYFGISYTVVGSVEDITKQINDIRNHNLIEDYKLKQQYGVTNE